MPYIKPEDRPMFDTMADGLIKRCRNFDRATMRAVIANIVSYGLTRCGYLYDIDPSTDIIIKNLAKRIRVRGDTNYIICRVALESMKPEAGWGYHSLSDVVSVLESAIDLIVREIEHEENEELINDCASVCYDAADEIKRRLLGPYEDKCIFKNGDMACFANEDFVYIPPRAVDFSMVGLAGGGVTDGCGCTPLSGCQGICTTPPVAEAATDVPVSAAFTQSQYDEIERAARKQG